jgi:hypothetical protein
VESSEKSPLFSYLRNSASSDFIIGKDKFENLQINQAADAGGFHYFKDPTKPLSRYVKRFVLKQGKLSQKVCTVALIKNEKGKFEPRFDFQIVDLTKKSVEQLLEPVSAPENRLVKARVNLHDCHGELSLLWAFLNDCSDVELAATQYAVVTADQKQLLDKAIDAVPKEELFEAIGEKLAHQITERDINILTKRKNALGRFRALLHDPAYFAKYQEWLKERNKAHRPEDVWQHFFENNRWIFGYGLQLVACGSFDDRKLETVVVGADFLGGAGKRIDGLLKTKGAISRSLFTEIKQHTAPLLEKYDRSAVWAPAKDLRGAVAQVEKTIHMVNLRIGQNFHHVKDKEGVPSGEVVAFVKPRAVVLIGTLGKFQTPHGFNDEMFASFELYRQNYNGIEILTYDELYERARFIIEES